MTADVTTEMVAALCVPGPLTCVAHGDLPDCAT
jgi:hypothetical protein